MLDYRYEPLGAWPGARTHGTAQKPSPFRMTWGQSLDLLEKEIRALGGTEIVLRVDLLRGSHDLRNDGTLRAGAKVGGAVIVEFTARKVDNQPRLTYPCDTYRDLAANVRAIAGVLEGLRRAERYGVKTGGRQYLGFKTLPSMGEATMSPEQAAEIIADEAGVVNVGLLSESHTAKEIIRRAVARTHPDRNNGSRERYDRVDKARTVLSTHHGVSL